MENMKQNSKEDIKALNIKEDENKNKIKDNKIKILN